MVIHFLEVASLKKKSAPKSYDQNKKGLDFEDLLPKNLETFDENWRNGGCFSKFIFFFSRYMQQIFSLGQRIQRFEDLLKGQDVLEKLEQLEQKMYQIQDDAKDKFEELNNEVADNSTRISSTENQNIEQGKQNNIWSFYVRYHWRIF